MKKDIIINRLVSPNSRNPKSIGKVRIYSNFIKLNKSVQREKFTLPTIDQRLTELHGAIILFLSGIPGIICNIDDVYFLL